MGYAVSGTDSVKQSLTVKMFGLPACKPIFNYLPSREAFHIKSKRYFLYDGLYLFNFFYSNLLGLHMTSPLGVTLVMTN